MLVNLCRACYTITALKTTPKTQTTLKCSTCGLPLVLIEEKTEYLETNPYPLTVQIYNCSDPVCQSKKDKDNAARMKLRGEQEVARKDREVQRQASLALNRRGKKAAA